MLESFGEEPCPPDCSLLSPLPRACKVKDMKGQAEHTTWNLSRSQEGQPLGKALNTAPGSLTGHYTLPARLGKTPKKKAHVLLHLQLCFSSPFTQKLLSGKAVHCSIMLGHFFCFLSWGKNKGQGEGSGHIRV